MKLSAHPHYVLDPALQTTVWFPQITKYNHWDNSMKLSQMAFFFFYTYGSQFKTKTKPKLNQKQNKTNLCLKL